jgi:class 3 adenylate cyclase/tetratricopeptide (TPR) repeat protein
LSGVLRDVTFAVRVVLSLAGFNMKCPKCLQDNSLDGKFCEQCAAPLTRACTICGSAASSIANFCIQCGHPLEQVADAPRFGLPKNHTPPHLTEKIVTSRATPEDERKQVTVLFADIKGSMELIAEQDPEHARNLLDPVLELMIEAVHRCEGTVNNVLGDGIMALFGAPLAREDHALSACYAALRMQETVKVYAEQIRQLHGVPLAIRVGLNSGEIVVGIIGNDLYMEYAAVGQTVHLAARMEQMAKPGSVFTTASTMQLVEGYISAKPLGRLPVKGLVDPIPIFELIGAGTARTRLQAFSRHGLTPFTGREVELEQLHHAQQLADVGLGQVAAIVGEPGVGKSRLVREFLHYYDTKKCLILHSSPASFERAIPYLPIIELLRLYFNIGLRDSIRAIREKVAEKISTLDQPFQDAIPPVLDLLDSLDDEHPFRSLDLVQRRQHTYQAVIRLLLTESRAQPVVVLFEDLHWYDILTLALLNELVVSAQNARLLLLVTYRPEYSDKWRNRPNYRQLRLDPLLGENLAEFLQALLGTDRSLSTLKSFLAERASGNPFFVEEIVRTLVDNGTLDGARGGFRLTSPFSSIDVPPTLQAVLAARIDALPVEEKQLLQEAAVIGQDIPFGLLQAICGRSEETLLHLLDSLQASEFLYTTQPPPDLQYTFKHSITRDVAYGGMLRERRRVIHAHVVDAIEKAYVDRLAEQVERLAYHADRSELKEKAVHYQWQAGAKAAGRAALPDARVWYEQALDILKSLPETTARMEQAFEIRLELRTVLRQLGELRPMLNLLREAEALAERLKDDVRRGRVCSFMTAVLSNLDQLDEAVVTSTRCVEIAQRIGDLRLGIIARSNLAQPYYLRGEYEQAIEIAAGNLAALPTEWVHEYFGMAMPASVLTWGWLIMSLAELGRFREAAEYEAEAIRVAAATKHTHTIGWAHLTASKLHLLQGDWAKAHLLLGQCINMPGTLDVAVLLPWAVASSAWTLAQIGDASEALSRVREGEEHLERQEAKGIFAHRGWSYHAVGRACLVLGRLDDAKRFADRSIESSRYQPGLAAYARCLLGDLAIHPDHFDAESAATHYQEALALAELRGMRPLVAHCHSGMTQLYYRLGKPEDARQHFTAATGMYREMNMGSWLAQLETV